MEKTLCIVKFSWHRLVPWLSPDRRHWRPTFLSRAPPPVYLPPPPIFTWTGVYIGGQIGYAWSSGNNNFNGFDPFFGTGTFLETSIGGTPSGVIGGVLIVGYNYQINQWVS